MLQIMCPEVHWSYEKLLKKEFLCKRVREMLYIISASCYGSGHISIFKDKGSFLDRLVMLWLSLDLRYIFEEKSLQMCTLSLIGSS